MDGAEALMAFPTIISSAGTGPTSCYQVAVGDLLLKFTGDQAPSGWTVISQYPELCWKYATEAGTWSASDLAYPPIRQNPPEGSGVPWDGSTWTELT